MPFDCSPNAYFPKQLPAAGDETPGFGTNPAIAQTVQAKPFPAWILNSQRECAGDTLAVLVRARELIADERRWCQRSFARSWLDIPVPVGSALVRRYCALGAIKRAGLELGLPADKARSAIKQQTVRSVADWNDDPLRTHAEVLAAFDACINERIYGSTVCRC
jgi:hypothetical protein